MYELNIIYWHKLDNYSVMNLTIIQISTYLFWWSTVLMRRAVDCFFENKVLMSLSSESWIKNVITKHLFCTIWLLKFSVFVFGLIFYEHSSYSVWVDELIDVRNMSWNILTKVSVLEFSAIYLIIIMWKVVHILQTFSANWVGLLIRITLCNNI